MRTIKRLLVFVIILAVAAYAGMHWFVRTNAGTAHVAKSIERQTGYNADISSAGLTWGMNLIVSDMRLWSKAANGTTNVLLVAPEAVVAGCAPCHERAVRLVRPIFTASKSELGSWTPTRAYEIAKGGRFDEVAARLVDKLEYNFELVDASVIFKDGNGDVIQTFSGLDWSRSKAKVKGHPDVRFDKVSLQFIDNSAVEFKGEWFVENGLPFGLGNSGEMLVLRSLEAEAPVAEDGQTDTPKATEGTVQTVEDEVVETDKEPEPAAEEEVDSEPVVGEAKVEETPPVVQEAQ